MTLAPPEAPARTRRPTKSQPSVLFDAPGPKARMRSNILTGVSALVLLAFIYAVIVRLNREDQFQAKLWKPFIKAEVWNDFILPGLANTLKAAAVGAVLALVLGVFLGLGRLSDHAWVRVPASLVVEFFRAIPLLLLIFFIFSGPATIATAFNREPPSISAFLAVVLGLALYNGAVLAEIFRAGILSVPRGQSEAAYAIGLRKNGVMRLILVPQATTAMMPAIISQLVVLLKDSALGWIIAYNDLLNNGFRLIPANYSNLVPAAIVITAIYIIINISLSYLANWLERRSRRSPRSTIAPLAPAQALPGTGLGQAIHEIPGADPTPGI